jgi:hypothetical protein
VTLLIEPILKPVWRNHDATAERDVLAFWREGRLLSQDVDLATRLMELCVIAYAEDRVVAVNTAVLTWLDQVRARIAMLRLAVAASYRQTHLATEMLAAAKPLLERWAAEHPAEKVMGIGCVVQTRAIGAKLNEAVWPRTGLAVIDHAPNGDQLRLAWFAKATVGDSATQ